MALTGEVGAKSTKLTAGSRDRHAAGHWACVPSPTVTATHFMFPEQFLGGKKAQQRNKEKEQNLNASCAPDAVGGVTSLSPEAGRGPRGPVPSGMVSHCPASQPRPLPSASLSEQRSSLMAFHG